MACYPKKQIFDGERPSYTNTNAFYASNNVLTKLCASNLDPGQTVPVLIKDNDDNYNNYVIDGQNVELTYNNPCVYVESDNWYKIDTTSISGTDVVVSTTQIEKNNLTSQTAWFLPQGSSDYIEVEILRVDSESDPIIYNLGTGQQIINPVGEFFLDKPLIVRLSENRTVTETPVPLVSTVTSYEVAYIQNTGDKNVYYDVNGNAEYVILPYGSVRFESSDEIQSISFFTKNTETSTIAITFYEGMTK